MPYSTPSSDGAEASSVKVESAIGGDWMPRGTIAYSARPPACKGAGDALENK